MGTATTISSRLAKVLHWAVDNAVVIVFTDVDENQVLVLLDNGVRMFVGELPDGRFIAVMCAEVGHVGVFTFPCVESFKSGLKVFSS